MNTSCARKLGNTLNRSFNIARGNHHQVRELIDNDQQVGIGSQFTIKTRKSLHLACRHSLVEIINMLKSVCRKIVVTRIHFLNDPLKRFSSLLWIGDDRGNQVRDTFVDRQFDSLGIDQDHANLRGCRAHHDRGNHRIHE